MAARPEDVWQCIKPVAGGLRTKWDQNVKDFEVVEAVSDVSSLRAVAVGLVSGGFRGIGLCLPKQPTSRAGKKKKASRSCAASVWIGVAVLGLGIYSFYSKLYSIVSIISGLFL